MRRWAFILIFGLGLTFLLHWIDPPFQSSLYNLMMELRGVQLPNSQIMIVTFARGESLELSDEESWITRLALLLNKFSKYPPLAVQLDFELLPKEETQLKLKNKPYPIFWYQEHAGKLPLPPILPLASLPEGLPEISDPTHHLHAVRGFIDARLIQALAPQKLKGISLEQPMLMNVVGPPGTYPTLKVDEIISNEALLHSLTKKVILVAPPDEKPHVHMASAPFFPKIGAAGVVATELHANTIDSIIREKSIRMASPSVSFILTTIASTLSAALLFATAPLLGILAIVFLVAVLILIELVTINAQVYIDLIKPLFAIGIVYYFLIPYRLIIEYKGRWRYQQENKILSEVETLKDNFMSLVSHNLKTPIAHIHGIIEALISKTGLDLRSTQEELKRILHATEDLDRFVSRILSLTRIENPKYQLRMSNRDVNAIVEKTIDILRPNAKENEIIISTKLEPLFPILMDGDLIQESVMNLIDNAIKYSSRKGKIEITTSEIGNWIKIDVADEGQGILESERDNIFSKFYRGAQVKNKGVSGSGLGLYLVKYFVELHGGSVELNNRPQGGSIFSIHLPRK